MRICCHFCTLVNLLTFLCSDHFSVILVLLSIFWHFLNFRRGKNVRKLTRVQKCQDTDQSTKMSENSPECKNVRKFPWCKFTEMRYFKWLTRIQNFKNVSSWQKSECSVFSDILEISRYYFLTFSLSSHKISEIFELELSQFLTFS